MGAEPMMYLVAIIVPPLALLLSGRLFHAIFNAIPWGLSIVIFVFSFGLGSFISSPLWIIAVVHAIYLVHKERAEDRMREIAEETMRE
jgi:mannitol-specific phosphotransferase system IIBC component